MSEFKISDAVAAALKLARDQYEEMATLGAGQLPADETNAMQVQLMRWQRDRFGLQVDTHDLRMALGIVEETGETFEAVKADDALDGLGDTIVYAGQLLMANRLALAPVLDLARVFAAAGGEMVPAMGVSKLAHTVLKASQKIRGLADREVYRGKLVEHVAMCLAKVIDDVEIGHGLAVRAAEVYRIVGAEVMQRKKGDAMIPTAPEGDPVVNISIRKIEVLSDDPDRFAQGLVDTFAAKEQALKDLKEANDRLGEVERIEGAGDFDARRELAAINACPVCAKPLESDGPKIVRCTGPESHAFTELEIQALKATETVDQAFDDGGA